MQVTSRNFNNLSINKINKNNESFDDYTKVAGNFERLGIEEKYTRKKAKKEQSSIISQENAKNIELRPEVAALEAAIMDKANEAKNSKNSQKLKNSKLKDITAKLINAANKAEGQDDELKNLKFKDILSQVIKDANKANLDNLENSKLENSKNRL